MFTMSMRNLHRTKISRKSIMNSLIFMYIDFKCDPKQLNVWYVLYLHYRPQHHDRNDT